MTARPNDAGSTRAILNRPIDPAVFERMSNITEHMIASVTGSTLDQARVYRPLLLRMLIAVGATSGPAACGLLAQIGIESGGLRHTREIWGPTSQQLRYEMPSALAKRLGNTRPGDGRLYAGIGLIQVTGRFNIEGALRRLDLPPGREGIEIAATPRGAVDISADWIIQNGAVAVAATGNARRLSRLVNRGNANATLPALHEDQRVAAYNLNIDHFTRVLA